MPYKFSAFYENKQGRKILLVEEIKLFLQELRRPQIGRAGRGIFLRFYDKACQKE